MKKILLATAALGLLLTGCSQERQACPRLSSNDDGSYTIAAPNPSAQPRDLEGCEYEFDEDGNLGTERDTDG